MQDSHSRVRRPLKKSHIIFVTPFQGSVDSFLFIRTKLRHRILVTWLLCLQQIHMRANQMPANLRFVARLRYRFIINLYIPYNYSAKYFWFPYRFSLWHFHHKYPMVPYRINIHILNVLCQSLHKDGCKNNLHKYVLYNITHNFRAVPKVIKLWIKLFPIKCMQNWRGHSLSMSSHQFLIIFDMAIISPATFP